MQIWSRQQTIPVFWWHRGDPNVGDEASGYIIRSLTPLKVVRTDKPITATEFFKNTLRLLCRLRLKRLYYEFKRLSFHKHILLSLGSIIDASTKKCVIWGSGFQNSDDRFNNGKILAVRGLETIKKLKHDGICPPEIIGDPGIIMPLLFRPKVHPEYNIGIIPHVREYDAVCKLISNNELRVINMRSSDVEYTIKEVLKCRCILSSSLHGLIFAHAYGKPALFFTYKHKGEGVFKYNDYFSSVGIPYYNPFELEDLLSQDSKWLQSFITGNKLAKPQYDILKIQQNLISVAPFELRDQFVAEKLAVQLIEEKAYLNHLSSLV